MAHRVVCVEAYAGKRASISEVASKERQRDARRPRGYSRNTRLPSDRVVELVAADSIGRHVGGLRKHAHKDSYFSSVFSPDRLASVLIPGKADVFPIGALHAIDDEVGKLVWTYAC